MKKNEAMFDPGEPMCFACGVHATDPDEPPEWPSVWNQARLLERAHLVPRALGGTDDPSNQVLLCPTCHHGAPDVSDPSYMLGWIERRESSGARHIRMIEEVIERVDVSGIVEDWTVERTLRLDAIVRDLLRDWSGTHGLTTSHSTFEAALEEGLKRFIEEFKQER